MNERPRFFDDLAGMAGGAMSALQGLRDEIEAMTKARIEEAIRKLELVKREQLDALAEVATKAREGQIAAETRIAALEARLAALESKDAPAHDVVTPQVIPLPDETPHAAPTDAGEPPIDTVS